MISRASQGQLESTNHKSGAPRVLKSHHPTPSVLTFASPRSIRLDASPFSAQVSFSRKPNRLQASGCGYQSQSWDCLWINQQRGDAELPLSQSIVSVRLWTRANTPQPAITYLEAVQARNETNLQKRSACLVACTQCQLSRSVVSHDAVSI
jgi:hypothetical protein